MATIQRRAYAEMFGPTTGDRLRLADTELMIGPNISARPPATGCAWPTPS